MRKYFKIGFHWLVKSGRYIPELIVLYKFLIQIHIPFFFGIVQVQEGKQLHVDFKMYDQKI